MGSCAGFRATQELRAPAPAPALRHRGTHGGRGAINHYQASKGASAGSLAATQDGFVLVVADTIDPEPIGNETYKEMLRLLKKLGPAAYRQLITSGDWTWFPDQWVAQVWAKILDRVPEDHLFYYSPQTDPADYVFLPGAGYVPEWATTDIPQLVTAFIEYAGRHVSLTLGRPPSIAYLPDGPYGIPVESV